LNETRKPRDTDLERLTRLKSLSWLSPSELTLLVRALALSNFKRREVIFDQNALASCANILLTGVARITCLNAHAQRVTVAMLPPGPIPEFPASPTSQSDFRCEAYNDCRVGSMSWNALNGIITNSSEMAFRKFHENNLKLWYRLLLRSSSFLNLGLRERIGITLLELCLEFGIEESRGTLLRVSFSHKDISHLVGASRPRVTEHLAQYERQGFVIRQGRQLVIKVANLERSMKVHNADLNAFALARTGNN
jgi:CRP-like cAMP-binding protein